jgi:hypothetical protein
MQSRGVSPRAVVLRGLHGTKPRSSTGSGRTPLHGPARSGSVLSSFRVPERSPRRRRVGRQWWSERRALVVERIGDQRVIGPFNNAVGVEVAVGPAGQIPGRVTVVDVAVVTAVDDAGQVGIAVVGMFPRSSAGAVGRSIRYWLPFSLAVSLRKAKWSTKSPPAHSPPAQKSR